MRVVSLLVYVWKSLSDIHSSFTLGTVYMKSIYHIHNTQPVLPERWHLFWWRDITIIIWFPLKSCDIERQVVIHYAVGDAKWVRNPTISQLR